MFGCMSILFPHEKLHGFVRLSTCKALKAFLPCESKFLSEFSEHILLIMIRCHWTCCNQFWKPMVARTFKGDYWWYNLLVLLPPATSSLELMAPTRRLELIYSDSLVRQTRWGPLAALEQWLLIIDMSPQSFSCRQMVAAMQWFFQSMWRRKQFEEHLRGQSY
jgi:hypothetical protein